MKRLIPIAIMIASANAHSFCADPVTYGVDLGLTLTEEECQKARQQRLKRYTNIIRAEEQMKQQILDHQRLLQQLEQERHERERKNQQYEQQREQRRKERAQRRKELDQRLAEEAKWLEKTRAEFDADHALRMENIAKLKARALQRKGQQQ
jgi:penicillin-binding protein 1A